MRKSQEFKDFLKYMSNTYVFANSAQVAYYFTLSLFPILYILVMLMSIFSISNDVVLDILYYAFPKEAFSIIYYELISLSETSTKVGITTSAILAVWSASMFIYSLKTAVRLGSKEKKTHGFIITRLLSLVITIAFAIIIIFSIILVVSVNVATGVVTSYFGLNYFKGYISLIPSAAILLCDLVILYMVIPSKRVSIKTALPGAICAEILFVLAFSFFSYYLTRIADFSVLYGTLSSVMVLIIWLYICSFILVFGGLLNNYIKIRKEKTEENS